MTAPCPHPDSDAFVPAGMGGEYYRCTDCHAVYRFVDDPAGEGFVAEIGTPGWRRVRVEVVIPGKEQQP